MRLTDQEILIISQSAKKHFGDATQLILFGSRTDDQKRGGDIDLLLITKERLNVRDAFERKIAMLVDLEIEMGPQKIDLLVEHQADNRTILKTAKQHGVQLC